MKILIVEDNNINALLLETIITKKYSNFHLSFAENGKEAVEICEKDDFDLVFMDVMMPVMNGIEATKIILKNKPKLFIVGLTALATDDEKDEILDAGCADYISKPFDKELIYKVIESY